MLRPKRRGRRSGCNVPVPPYFLFPGSGRPLYPKGKRLHSILPRQRDSTCSNLTEYQYQQALLPGTGSDRPTVDFDSKLQFRTRTQGGVAVLLDSFLHGSSGLLGPLPIRHKIWYENEVLAHILCEISKYVLTSNCDSLIPNCERSCRMRVGLTFNMRREAPEDAQEPPGALGADTRAEWDTPETITAVRNALAERHEIIPIDASEDACSQLSETRPISYSTSRRTQHAAKVYRPSSSIFRYLRPATLL